MKPDIQIPNAPWWKDNEFVYIKPRQRLSDLEAIQNSITEFDQENNTVNVKLGSGIRATIEVMVTNWKKYDDEGAELMCSPQGVAKLESDDAMYIYKQIQQAAPKRITVNEKKDLLTSATTGISEEK